MSEKAHARLHDEKPDVLVIGNRQMHIRGLDSVSRITGSHPQRQELLDWIDSVFTPKSPRLSAGRNTDGSV